MGRFKNSYRAESVRLKNWNYAWNGHYFITICTANRECFFGEIVGGKMRLSETGKIAHHFWREIPNHFPFVVPDVFVVMPNHIHGIVVIDKRGGDVKNGNGYMDGTTAVETLQCNVSTTDTSYNPNNKNQFMANISPESGSVSTIVRSYKSAVTKHVRKIDPYFEWQSRFYDHIIRNESSYRRIQQYIINNPKNWEEDRFR